MKLPLALLPDCGSRHEGKAMGVQWYEQARASEVLEKTLKREKRKLETVLAQHESKAIADTRIVEMRICRQRLLSFKGG